MEWNSIQLGRDFGGGDREGLKWSDPSPDPAQAIATCTRLSFFYGESLSKMFYQKKYYPVWMLGTIHISIGLSRGHANITTCYYASAVHFPTVQI